MASAFESTSASYSACMPYPCALSPVLEMAKLTITKLSGAFSLIYAAMAASPSGAAIVSNKKLWTPAAKKTSTCV